MTRATRTPGFGRSIGFDYFAIAIGARLPFAMMVVGVLTMVVDARESLALGGLTSAVVGLATMATGPLLGMAADRYGQRTVLLLAGIANALGLVAIVLVAYSQASDASVLAAAAFTGATAPQVSAMSRTRMDAAVTRRGGTPRLREAVMGYESAVDEVVFVFGPAVVGLLAVALSPAAAVLSAAGLTAVFVVLFALHRTARTATPAGGRVVAAPISALAAGGIVTVALGALAMGLFFGTALTALTAFTEARGAADQTGLIYGAMGVGSAVLALSVGLFPARFTLPARWFVFSLALLGGSVCAALAETPLQITLALLIAGCGIGPTLATVYTLAAQRAPFGRTATVMTMLGSGVIVGQALASAAVGALAESAAAPVVPWAPVISATLLVILALADRMTRTVDAMPEHLITISAVVFRDAHGAVLTVRKRGTSRFMLPGGKPEIGETAAEAAVREVREELGVDVSLDALDEVGVLHAPAANEDGHVVEATVFTCDALVFPEPAAEIEELRWLDTDAALPDDLAPLLEHRVLPVLAH